jgi:beta-N-acetylhexosaminidase
MKAITNQYGAGESAVLAALAGHDVIFFSHTRALQQEAYDALVAAAESGRLPEARIEQALARQAAFKARFPVGEARPLDVIRHPDHLAVCRRAAEAGWCCSARNRESSRAGRQADCPGWSSRPS